MPSLLPLLLRPLCNVTTKFVFPCKESKRRSKNKLSIEDMVLMTLEYLIEHRTYFRIGESCGILEFYAYKIIKWIPRTFLLRTEFSHFLGVNHCKKVM
ncbi:MAG: transposase family protein [Lactobacillales bacterium]|nr:transposase family protein [Lactobacillales bacterium]